MLDGDSSAELEYAYETQQDLFSKEELEFMLLLIDERKKEEAEAIARFLPDSLECPKCGAPNEFERVSCKYCEHVFDKRSYYERAEALAWGEYPSDYEDDESEEREGFLFQYVVSFIIPIVGYIVGAVMLAKDDPEKRSAGKACIILALLSSIISVVVGVSLLS